MRPWQSSWQTVEHNWVLDTFGMRFDNVFNLYTLYKGGHIVYDYDILIGEAHMHLFIKPNYKKYYTEFLNKLA